MTKLIKKSKCKFDNGYIVKKGKIVGIPTNVWLQINKLETIAQQYRYLKGQPKYSAGPTLEGFERKSILTAERPYVEIPDTPVYDAMVQKSMTFMAEIDKVNDANKVNMAIDEYGALIDWLGNDKFVEGTCTMPIDTPELGNPLTLDPKDVVDFLEILVSEDFVLEA